MVNYSLAKKSNKVDSIILNFIRNGYSLVNQIYSIHNLVLKSKKIPSEIKSDIIITLANIDQNLIKGCDEYIQFMRFAYFLIYINSNNIEKFSLKPKKD